MTEIRTPKELQESILQDKDVISVSLLEYLDEPSIVVIIELRLLLRLKLLFSRAYKKSILLHYKKVVQDAIPPEIKTEVILSL